MMSYGTGYKRPRTEEYGSGYDAMPYGPPGDFGPPMGTGIGPGGGLHASVSQTGLGVGLGSGPDGQLPVIKLRGLPFSCDEQDVKVFLEVDTVDILFTRRDGRFSGEAYVVLPGMMQVDFALGKHKAYLGRRYVEVQSAQREDYYKAVAAQVEDGPETFARRRAPYETRDRADRAPGFGASIGLNGTASPPMMPRGPLRDAPVRDFPVPRGPRDMPRGGPSGAWRYERDRMPPAVQSGETAILRLRGLPFSASREDVAAWFNSSGALNRPIDEASVHLVLAYDGRPTGSAFVEFLDPTDALHAMVKDKAMMGNRYVELFHSSREEVSQATAGAY